MAKTIITAALTGAVTPAGYKIPETPQQIADAVRRVPLDGAQDPRARLQALDAQARRDLQAMLEGLL